MPGIWRLDLVNRWHLGTSGDPVSDHIKAKDQSGSVQNRTPDPPLFRLGIQSDHQAFAAPKLNGVINDKAFSIVSASLAQTRGSYPMKCPSPSTV
jgi:hypothetical protein